MQAPFLRHSGRGAEDRNGVSVSGKALGGKTAKSNEQVMQEFNEAVNMTRKELEEWLQTEESKSVGQSDGP